MASNSIHSEIARLNAIESSYDRRREMEAIPVDHQFAAKIQINKIERFYGYIREEGYRDGKAIIGLLDGTEQEIKSALDMVSKNRTTLVIAHRLSTVTDADWGVVDEVSQITDLSGNNNHLVTMQTSHSGDTSGLKDAAPLIFLL